MWWKLVLASLALAAGVSSKERQGHEYGEIHSEFKLGTGDHGSGAAFRDRVEVMSSALRILPRKSSSAKAKSLGEVSRPSRSADESDLSRWALVPTMSAEKKPSNIGVDFKWNTKSTLINSKLDAIRDGKSRLASSELDNHDGKSELPRQSEWVKRVSSGVTVDNSERPKRSSGGNWRTPREYQFVTRDRSNDASRSARLLEPESSASRYYPDERPFYPESRTDHFRRRSDGYRAPTKRIIYYATLPEIVRRPGEWTPPRPIYGGFQHNPRDNEIFPRPEGPFSDGGTRVSSGVIGFSDKHETLKGAGYQDDLSSPTFTIIDAEPPYNYGHHSGPPPMPLPERYDNRYDQDRYDYDRYDNRYDQDKYDQHRYDQRFNSYRNTYADPYRQFYERRQPQPPRHPQIALPPQPITIVRKPLDVRPLDPDSDYTTQGAPHASSTASTHSPSASSTSTTSSPQLSSYERTFDGRKF